MALSFLGTDSILRDISDEEMQRLKPSLTRIELMVGDALCTQGELTRGLFLLEIGRAEVAMQLNPAVRPHVITELVAPTVVGEMEFINAAPSVCTVTVIEPAIGYLLAHDAFQDLVAAGDQVAAKIFHNSAVTVIQRLIESNQRLIEAVDPAQRPRSIAAALCGLWKREHQQE